jgi:hypothetical protein
LTRDRRPQKAALDFQNRDADSIMTTELEALEHIVTCRLDTRVPAGLCDTTKEALRNRVTIERYNAERPEKDYPEHTLWPRAARNASPTRKKDAGQLNAFWEYRELNESTEPLQSNFLRADNENYIDRDWEEGDQIIPERDLEAELETRPNETELIEGYDVPTVQYKTRQVGLRTGPKLSDCGYCMAPTSPLIGDQHDRSCGETFHGSRSL